jgi:hypothetical protein
MKICAQDRIFVVYLCPFLKFKSFIIVFQLIFLEIQLHLQNLHILATNWKKEIKL